MIYYFGGINGSGKSTLLARIARESDFEVVHLTRRLIEFMGLETYDDIRKLPQSHNRQQLNLLMKCIIGEGKQKNLLLDAHYLNLCHGKISHITNDWIKDLSAIVLVESDPGIVYQRISNDSRDRAHFTKALSAEEYIKRLGDYQKQTHKEFLKLAKNYNLPSIILSGEDWERSTSRFLNFAKEIASGKLATATAL